MPVKEYAEKLKKHCLFVSFLPGIFAFLIYKMLACLPAGRFVFSLFSARETVSQILTTYSVTFLGFLLTVITIASSLPSNYRIRKYKKDGYFSVYVRILSASALHLFLCLLLSFLLLSQTIHMKLILMLAMTSFVNSLCMVMLSFLITFNLLNNDEK